MLRLRRRHASARGRAGRPWRICDWCAELFETLEAREAMSRTHPRGREFSDRAGNGDIERRNEARRPAHIPPPHAELADLQKKLTRGAPLDPDTKKRLVELAQSPDVRAIQRARDVCYFCDATNTLSAPGFRFCRACLRSVRVVLREARPG